MATAKSTIRFDLEHKLEVLEERSEILRLVRETGAPRVPLIELTRPDGSKVSANADQIRLIAEH